MPGIKTPCTANWEAMTATERGAHCHFCQKEVVDITQKSNQEIKKLKKGICVKMYEDQMSKPHHQSDYFKVTILGFTLLLSSPILAQTNTSPPLKETVAKESDTLVTKQKNNPSEKKEKSCSKARKHKIKKIWVVDGRFPFIHRRPRPVIVGRFF